MTPSRRRALVVAVPAIVLVGAGAAFVGLGLGRTATPTAFGGVPHFVDETATSGLGHTYDGNDDYQTGGGIAVFDCNDDGRPDVYVAGGQGNAALFRNDSPRGGSLRFTPIHDAATDLADVNGAYPIDVDGDGRADLVVLRNSGNVILRGLGDCRFAPANETWKFDGGSANSTAFSATWEAGATWPTIAIGNYVNPAIQDPTRWCEDNLLVRPSAAGGAFAAPIPLKPGWCALSMLFSDWDGSGRMDLRISNDDHYYPSLDGGEQLWRLDPGAPPRPYTADDGWVTVQIEGMGIASYDVTGDGLPDVYLTSQYSSRLQTLASGPSRPTYRDIGLKRGVNVTTPFTGGEVLPSTAWHPEFQDVNNDGLIDLFVSKGNVAAQPDFAQKDPSNLLLGQPDGTFKEAADTAGILSFARGRGAALADFNMDGWLDLVEVNYGAPVRLWRNTGAPDVAASATSAHWLGLQLHEPGPNADAIGATIEVRAGDLTLRREVTIGGGHIGGQLGWIHFGLGPAAGAQVRVTWPGGEVGPWLQVAADQYAVVDRGAGQVRPWTPAGQP